MIELKAISKTLSGERILENISLRVGNGECAVILGESDEQRILLSSIAAGAIDVSSGSVSVSGYNLSKHKLKAASQIGFVPAEGALYERMTVREFLFFVAEAKGIPYERMGAKITDSLSFFDLEAYADRLASKIPYSARRRALLAQALLADPSALVLCDPFEELDAPSKKMFSSVIVGLAEKGASIIVICNEDSLPDNMNKSIYRLDGSSLISLGENERNGECE